jgi:acyl-CoA synthetase (NDP forming)
MAVIRTYTAFRRSHPRTGKTTDVMAAGKILDGELRRTFGGLALTFALARPGHAKISVVHPEASDIQGAPCVRSVADLPFRADVVFVSVPARGVKAVVRECADNGVKFVIVGSSGFAEMGAEGVALQAELTQIARDRGVRLLGPNCNGLWNVMDGLSVGFNTSHEHALRSGGIGIVGQTGAVLGSFIAGVERMGGGIAYAVSTGNEADIDAAECFEFMAHDDVCGVIALLLDAVGRTDVFESAARHAAKVGKPVLVYKFGKSRKGQHAAQLHSARVAGGPLAFSAWLRALGIAEAPDLESAMFAAALLATGQRFEAGLGVLSTSGAGAAIVADLASEWDVDLPEFGADTFSRLSGLYEFSVPYNPLDLAGQSNDPAWLAEVMDAVFSEPAFGAVALLATLLPPKQRGVALVASVFSEVKQRHNKVACAYAVGPLAEEHRADLVAAGIPIADSGHTLLGGLQTVATQSGLATRRDSWPAAHERAGIAVSWPNSFTSTRAAALVLHDAARPVLENLGVRFVGERSVDSRAEAAKAFLDLGGPVAMKLMDGGLPHKASAGGLVLNVNDEEQAGENADWLLARALSCDARVLVQEMVPIFAELFIGTVNDLHTGQVISQRTCPDCPTDRTVWWELAVEDSPDVAVELAPVSMTQAVEMVNSVSSVSSVASMLVAVEKQTQRPVESLVDDVATLVVLVSELAAGGRDVVDSIDINPVILTSAGQMAALDVRVQLKFGGQEPQIVGH